VPRSLNQWDNWLLLVHYSCFHLLNYSQWMRTELQSPGPGEELWLRPETGGFLRKSERKIDLSLNPIPPFPSVLFGLYYWKSLILGSFLHHLKVIVIARARFPGLALLIYCCSVTLAYSETPLSSDDCLVYGMGTIMLSVLRRDIVSFPLLWWNTWGKQLVDFDSVSEVSGCGHLAVLSGPVERQIIMVESMWGSKAVHLMSARK
jgi:hypothetical protein